jgi:hypothetical protein
MWSKQKMIHNFIINISTPAFLLLSNWVKTPIKSRKRNDVKIQFSFQGGNSTVRNVSLACFGINKTCFVNKVKRWVSAPESSSMLAFLC